jgi:uncharacterized protein (DUF1330 family)
MPAYVVVEIDVTDPAAYERYKVLAPPSIAAYGGRYLVRGAPVECLEGGWRPPRFVLLEFPDAGRARAGGPRQTMLRPRRSGTPARRRR